MIYPKLRYPINTHQLVNEDRLILLAYDMIWRARDKFDFLDDQANMDYLADLEANLSNLGAHIESVICNDDMSLRFEGYEDAEATKTQWQKITQEELNKTNSQI